MRRAAYGRDRREPAASDHEARTLHQNSGEALGKVPGQRPVGEGICPRTLHIIVSTDRADSTDEQHLELPVDELLRRARPLPPRDQMVIDDLTEEEGEAFLAAIDS